MILAKTMNQLLKPGLALTRLPPSITAGQHAVENHSGYRNVQCVVTLPKRSRKDAFFIVEWTIGDFRKPERLSLRNLSYIKNFVTQLELLKILQRLQIAKIKLYLKVKYNAPKNKLLLLLYQSQPSCYATTTISLMKLSLCIVYSGLSMKSDYLSKYCATPVLVRLTHDWEKSLRVT